MHDQRLKTSKYLNEKQWTITFEMSKTNEYICFSKMIKWRSNKYQIHFLLVNKFIVAAVVTNESKLTANRFRWKRLSCILTKLQYECKGASKTYLHARLGTLRLRIYTHIHKHIDKYRATHMHYYRADIALGKMLLMTMRHEWVWVNEWKAGFPETLCRGCTQSTRNLFVEC